MNLPALTPVLIALIRSGLSHEPAPAPVAQRLDDAAWQDLLQLATRHDLVPLLNAGVVATSLTPPEPIAAALRHQARASEVRNYRAGDQLKRILTALNAKGIEPLLLKGILFAICYYRSPGLRPFGDIDFVVPSALREQAEEVLQQIGYTHAEDPWGHDRNFYLEEHFHWPFTLEEGVPVEMHWAIVSPCSGTDFDMERLWKRSLPLVYGKTTARMFAPEDQIFYLAVHIARHHFHVPLRNFVDLQVLIEATPHLDWQGVWQRAQALQAEKELASVLGTAHTLGLLALPADVAERVRRIICSRHAAALARYAVAWPYVDCPSVLSEMLNVPTLRTAMRMGRQLLFPTPAPRNASTGVSGASGRNREATESGSKAQRGELQDAATREAAEPAVAPRTLPGRRLLTLLRKVKPLLSDLAQLRTLILIRRFFRTRQSP